MLHWRQPIRSLLHWRLPIGCLLHWRQPIKYLLHCRKCIINPYHRNTTMLKLNLKSMDVLTMKASNPVRSMDSYRGTRALTRCAVYRNAGSLQLILLFRELSYMHLLYFDNWCGHYPTHTWSILHAANNLVTVLTSNMTLCNPLILPAIPFNLTIASSCCGLQDAGANMVWTINLCLFMLVELGSKGWSITAGENKRNRRGVENRGAGEWRRGRREEGGQEVVNI